MDEAGKPIHKCNIDEVIRMNAPSPNEKDLPNLLKSARAFEEVGQYDKAYGLLQRCAKTLSENEETSDLFRVVQQSLLRLTPLWWANVQHGGISLRRCNADDAGFFRRCFADAQFCRQFNRQQLWRGNLEQALKKSGQLPPIQTGLLMWVVQSANSGPIGLASLSSIDTINCRAELSIGLPGEVPPTLGIKATLMMLHFALVMMRFNKIYSYIYEDNHQALHNALRLGFVHEGTLKDHFHISGHGFVNVHLLGLTRAQLNADENLKRLAQRKIGQTW